MCEQNCMRVLLVLSPYIVKKPILYTTFFTRHLRSSRLCQGGLQKVSCPLITSAKIHFGLGTLLLTALSVTNYFMCTPKEISQDCQQHWSHFSLPDVILVHLLTLALHNMKKNWRLWSDTAINLVNDFPLCKWNQHCIHNLHN